MDLQFLDEIDNLLDFGQDHEASPHTNLVNRGIPFSTSGGFDSHLLTESIGCLQHIQSMLRQERARVISENDRIMEQNAVLLGPPSTFRSQQNVSLKKENSNDFFAALVNSDHDREQEPVSDHGKRIAVQVSSEEQSSMQEAKSEDLKHRNRQSAKASRERKKAKFDHLHHQVNELIVRNSELQQTLHEVKLDNDQLKDELSGLGYRGDFTNLSKLVKTMAPVKNEQVDEGTKAL